MEKVIFKLELDGGECRLAQAEVPVTMAGLRRLVAAKFGLAAAACELTYTLAGDPDRISLREDEDVALALELRSFGDQPLKVYCAPPAPPVPKASFGEACMVEEAEAGWAPPAYEESRDTYQQACETLAKYGVEATAAEVEALVKALDFSPRRLVKANLAHPKSLKHLEEAAPRRDAAWDEDAVVVDTPDGPRVVDEEEEEEEEAQEVSKLAELTIEAREAARVVDEEGGEGEGGEGEDACVAALRRKGVQALDGRTIHVLLRVLRTQPKRFVKVGLVEDIKVARAAYKAGASAAARLLVRTKLVDRVKLGRCVVVGDATHRGKILGAKHHGKGGRGKGHGKGCKGGRGHRKGGLVAYDPRHHRRFDADHPPAYDDRFGGPPPPMPPPPPYPVADY